MKTPIQLLPCPFCGQLAILDASEIETAAGVRPFVKCSDDEDCRAFGPDGKDPAEAVAKWNRRFESNSNQ